jgi:hypothetical protein
VRHQFGGAERLAIHPAALLEVHEMRLDVQGGSVARLARNAVQHGTSRTLAVGTGHGDDRRIEAAPHARPHRGHALQAHVDGLGVRALAVGEPLVERAAGDHRCTAGRCGGDPPRAAEGD